MSDANLISSSSSATLYPNQAALSVIIRHPGTGKSVSVCASALSGAMHGWPRTVSFSNSLLHAVAKIQTYQLEADEEIRWSSSISEIAVNKLLSLTHGLPYSLGA